MFGLDGYKITSQAEDAEGIHLHVEIVGTPPPCPCGGKLLSNGKRAVMIRDVNVGHKMVGSEVARQRYICKRCSKAYVQNLPGVDPGHLMTSRLVDFIAREGVRRTHTDVANQIGIDEGTVRSIVLESADGAIEKLTIKTPRYIGLDEIRLGKVDHAVIVNLEEMTIYDIRPSRTTEELDNFFQALPDRNSVEGIVIDIWDAYRKVIRKNLSCPIVLDKFHLIAKAQHSMEAARKSVRAGLKKSELSLVKSDRKLVLTRISKHSEERQEELAAMLNRFPVLAECHAALVGFHTFWETADAETCSAKLEGWRQSIGDHAQPFYASLIRTTESWAEEIRNFFTLGLNNGGTESLNNLIRQIAEAGRGYSYENLRRRILLNLAVRKEKRVFRRPTRSPRASVMGLSMREPFEESSSDIVVYGADLTKILGILNGEMASEATSENLVDMLIAPEEGKSIQPDLF